MNSMLPSPQAGRIPEWTVGDRLRKARESAGLEQIQLANVAGISRATISAAENGRSVGRATRRLWALATGVPFEWIETGKAPSPDGTEGQALPRLDSNQQPIGFTPRAPRGELIRVDFRRAA